MSGRRSTSSISSADRYGNNSPLNHPDHKIVDGTKIRDDAVVNRPIYVALAVTGRS
ncbi:hypothetical protein [Streptomyces sp. NPDC048191]|uniref:hypothetical protein n=1 Tax=Streptomyces sp. NPDC048191 TaxID=3155484 RepID=UPI0033D2BA3D